MTEEKNIIKDFVELGTEISGGVGGAVIGSFVPGPLGDVLSGITAPFITKLFKTVGAEIKDRFLSRREQVRIGAAYTFAINKINENQAKGLSLRDDGFFDDTVKNRPAGEELLEGMLLAAQREYQEQKLKYLGILYANVCFNPSVSKEHANQLIRTADSLSFRQLCMLQLLNERYVDSQQLNFKIRGLDKWEIGLFDVVAEIRDLQQKGLAHIPTTFDGGDNSAPIQLAKLSITHSGRFFCEILELNEIERDYLDEINELTAIKN